MCPLCIRPCFAGASDLLGTLIIAHDAILKGKKAK
jgi:hypothetical protein